MLKYLEKYKKNDSWKGAGFPFIRDDKQPIKFEQDKELLESAMIQLFGTRFKERVMRPDFGMRNVQWLPNDAFFAGDIQYAIQEALYKYEPRLQLINIEIIQTDSFKNDNTAGIRITVQLKNNPRSTASILIPMK